MLWGTTKKVTDRARRLMGLGLNYNGKEFVYRDINFHHSDLLCMTDEEFEKAFEGASKRKQQIAEEIKKGE